MVLRRKMCVVVVATAILFLMIASQTISPSLFLSLSLSLATPAGQAPPASRTTPQPLGPSGHPGPSLPHRHDNIGEGARGEGPEGVGLEGEGSPHAEGSQPGGEASAGRTNDKDQSEASSKAVVTPEPPRPSGAQGRSDRMCGCTESCVSELDGSAWFKQRFDPHQQPLLHNSNKMDASALKWWLGLQRSDGQTLEEVMSKLFRVISPPSVDIRPRPSRCHSCAVVGNSGNLRQSGHGSLINTHNSVIRMNKAITAGFEQDVGNRTTHHFLYPESAVDIASGVSLVLLPFKLRDLEWLASALSTGEIKMTYMRVKDRVQADKDKVLVVNPEFFKYTHDNWTEHHGRYPSTGLLAIVFALHICDQVSVFGYGADSEGNWHHYWEENRYAGAFRKTGVHSADFETEVIHRLAKEGKIHLYPSVV